jgi:hypothetical protein
MKIEYREYFKGEIDEIFNTIYPYVRNKQHIPSREMYSFSVPNGDEYTVIIDTNSLYMTDYKFLYNQWYVGIDIRTVEVKDIMFGKKSGHYFDFHILGDKENVGGIFGTVLDIIRKNVNSDDIITFSAEEESRKKLYDRMAEKFKSVNNGDVVTRDGDGAKYYFIVPKEYKGE